MSDDVRVDDIIEDAHWDGDDGELGPYSLHRDGVGFITVAKWVKNVPVEIATVKGPVTQ